MQVRYTKCLKDTASNPEPVMLAREKRPRSRSHSGSPPCKCLVMETHGDIDSDVVKTSANFKLTMDFEIAKLFYAYNLPLSIAYHDQFVKVVKMFMPRYVPSSGKAITGPLLDTVTEQLNETCHRSTSETTTSPTHGYQSVLIALKHRYPGKQDGKVN